MSTRIFKFTLLALFFVSGHGQASANNDAEAEILKRFLVELDVVIEMTHEGDATHSPGQIDRFRFDLLKRDLEAIKLGIEDHLNNKRDLTYERDGLWVDKTEY
ncbi:TPA: hypothetical protein I7682_17985 [Vibrio vulnificus]|nr:hypothetical protein [Vibrio vulnificus]